jgi:uncharacterized protein YbbC (DUF1343 family)
MFRNRSPEIICLFISLLLPRPSALTFAKKAIPSYNAKERTKTGIEVLEQQGFAPLRGNRVGLITNQTGVDFEGRRTIDVLAHARGVKLVAIFSPEHGILGQADAGIGDSTDAATSVRIYSLFGQTRRPTAEMLRNVDALVFDIQDAGVRFYTYITTMAYCMEEAAKLRIPFYVLDRPDPLGGEVIEGPMLDAERTSFVGYFPMPVRYAMTLGELAKMFNAENKLGADLHVVAMKGWRRSETYDQTGLQWVPPSPNLRNLQAALLYPGIEILQAGGVSVGRGTGAPFEIFGAPWMHADELTLALNRANIPGVRFAPAEFTPVSDLYTGQSCQGATIDITDPKALDPIRMGIEIAEVLQRLYPERFQTEKMIELVGSKSTIERLKSGDAPARIVSGWSGEIDQFRRTREKYLLYH